MQDALQHHAFQPLLFGFVIVAVRIPLSSIRSRLENNLGATMPFSAWLASTVLDECSCQNVREASILAH